MHSEAPSRPPAPLDARASAGARGQAQGQARAVALLLLRRVLGAVPQGGRARRDDDEHAPLAHVQVRLQRPLGPVLPLVALGGHRDRAGGDPDRHRVHALRPSARRQHQRLRRRERLPARAIVHRFDWTMAIVLVILLGINVIRMWRFVMGGDRAPGPRFVRRRPATAAATTSSRSSSTASASASGRGRCTWRSC